LYISPTTLENPKTSPYLIFNLSSQANPINKLPIFIIDSGASLPMCYQSEVFTDMIPDNTPVKLGDGEIIYARGRGTVGTLRDVYFVPDLKFNLLSVHYLNNLGLSVTFAADGHVIMSDANKAQYYLGNFKNGLFRTSSNSFQLSVHDNKFSLSANALPAFTGRLISYATLLHQRFAHINDRYINIIFKQNLIFGIPGLKSRAYHAPFCESCVLAKAIRISSIRTPGSSHRLLSKNEQNTEIISKPKIIKKVRFIDEIEEIPSDSELFSDIEVSKVVPPKTSSLHSHPTLPAPPLTKFAVDLKGPINSGDSSKSAKKYCIIFTCVSSRYRFAGFLKSKDETVFYTEKLIKYLRSISKSISSIEQYSDKENDDYIFDNSMNELLKKNDIVSLVKPFSEMKSDCGGEFINAEMISMLGDNEVFHSTTSPYSPHQNGIAERSNRTVFDLAAACMHACGLAIKFWTYAVQYVIHTLNYLPNQALQLQSTPYITVFGIVPDVGYLRVFGCDAYMVLPDTKRPSFGLRAVKGIFVGYNHPHSLSYKVLYKGTIYDSGHVYFNEDLKYLQPQDEEFINRVKVFFNNIKEPIGYQLTEEDIKSFAEGRDSNDKIIKAADDPSSRRIEEIEIIEDITPVAQRTRGRKPRALTAALHVNIINPKFRKKTKISLSKLYDLRHKRCLQALLTNTYYYDDTCDVENLYQNEFNLLASVIPLTYSFITQLDSITVEEAMSSPEWPAWEKAMQEELNKLASISTWEFVDELPPGRKALLYK
jgi:hypothetical protein